LDLARDGLHPGQQPASAAYHHLHRDHSSGQQHRAVIFAIHFWSIILYDNQTRSVLQTDQRFPSVSSEDKDLKTNADSSVDIYVGPKLPPGVEHNWVQTVPGKGWFTLFRLYGPLQPWFDKTCRLPDIEEVK
jgi:hypothetical protein